ncbi:hypothetical protein BBU72A_I0012 (plasmid) [Borreliella burgdorferi 72a]|nr:hypothetical protein BBU72A_I0012 [Borreliella burgdorferi 72a]
MLIFIFIFKLITYAFKICFNIVHKCFYAFFSFNFIFIA